LTIWCRKKFIRIIMREKIYSINDSKNNSQRWSITPSLRGDSFFYKAIVKIKHKINKIRAIIRNSDTKRFIVTSFRGYKLPPEVFFTFGGEPRLQFYQFCLKILFFRAIITNIDVNGGSVTSLRGINYRQRFQTPLAVNLNHYSTTNISIIDNPFKTNNTILSLPFNALYSYKRGER